MWRIHQALWKCSSCLVDPPYVWQNKCTWCEIASCVLAIVRESLQLTGYNVLANVYKLRNLGCSVPKSAFWSSERSIWRVSFWPSCLHRILCENLHAPYWYGTSCCTKQSHWMAFKDLSPIIVVLKYTWERLRLTIPSGSAMLGCVVECKAMALLSYVNHARGHAIDVSTQTNYESLMRSEFTYN